MRVAVMGAGGQGGLLGGLLARASSDVTLIARGEHLKAIHESGLTLKSNQGDEFTVQVNATDDPREVGHVDLLLFCVKSYDIESAAEIALPLVGGSTVVLPVQNGVNTSEQLERVFGQGKVLGGASYLAGSISSPGVISYGGISGKLLFGELNGGTSKRTEELLNTFQQATIDAEIHTNIRVAIWEKFIVNCATGGVLSVLRLPIGPVLACPESGALMRGVMEEAYALGRASGILSDEGTVDRWFGFFKSNVAPATRSSSLVALTEGRPLELDDLNGSAVSLGRELGVPTPLNFAVYAALKPYIKGAPSLPE